MYHTGVGWVMQGWGGSYRGGVAHAGVGWVMQGWGVVGHVEVQWVMQFMQGWGGLITQFQKFTNGYEGMCMSVVMFLKE